MNSTYYAFPMLMQNPKSGTVFLITGQKETGAFKGVVIQDTTSNPFPMGRYSDHWKKTLIPYEGSIQIQNG